MKTGQLAAMVLAAVAMRRTPWEEDLVRLNPPLLPPRPEVDDVDPERSAEARRRLAAAAEKRERKRLKALARAAGG